MLWEWKKWPDSKTLSLQYVSASWDGHINLWTAWSRQRSQANSRNQFRPMSSSLSAPLHDAMDVEKKEEELEVEEKEKEVDKANLIVVEA